MPKLPSKIKQEQAAKKADVCKACNGTGKSSSGGNCIPCIGRGVPYTWRCSACGSGHHGFYNKRCRNTKCKLFNKDQ